MNKKKLIAIDLFPNFEQDDYHLIKKILRHPSEWLEGRELDILKYELKKYFPDSEIFLFSTERGALEFFLKIYLRRTKIKNVLTQGFTCFVVPKAIIQAGGNPLFVDIGEGMLNFNIDKVFQKLKEEQASVLILQNTLGVPNNIEDFLNLSRENNLLLIENLAHSFTAKYKGKFLGNFGDVALISFGKTKVISGIFGSALILNRKDFLEEVIYEYRKIGTLRKKWIFKALIYTLLMIKNRENFNLYGKYLMRLMRFFKLTLPEISTKEKIGRNEIYLIKKMPNAFAKLILNQLKKIIKFNEHREEIAKIYLKEGLIPYGEQQFDYEYFYLRFPLVHNNKKELFNFLKKYNIYLGNWYNSPLAPLEKRLDLFGYYYGMCPNAEKLSMIIYNLPTNILISKDDALLISELIKKFY